MMRVFANLQTFWDWRAAGNYIFGGTGGMLMLWAALSYAPGSAPRLLMLLAMACIGAGLGSVWLEIGRPLRALNVYRHIQTSWMTREAFVAIAVLALGLATVFTSIPALSWMAGLTGGLFVYCQGRILKAAKGIPAWREPAMLRLIVLTGLVEGLGLFIVASHVLGLPAFHWQPLALVVLVAVRGWTLLGYRRALASKASAVALAKLDRQRAVLIWGGHVLPMLLGLLALPSLPFPLQTVAVLLASLAALAGGWWMKFVIVTRAAHVQGYALGQLRRGHPLASTK